MRPFNSGLTRGNANTATAGRERERLERASHTQLNDISEEQREEINEAVHSSQHIAVYMQSNQEQFQLFDLDKDGYIDYHELKAAMKSLGFTIPKPDLAAILQTHGVLASTLTPGGAPKAPGKQPAGAPTITGPGKLLMPQSAFQNLLATRIAARDPRDEILRAFELFDADGKGGITVDDLRRVTEELNEGLGEEELNAMIEEFDINGDGLIGKEEFLGICLG
jgi:centrin-3